MWRVCGRDEVSVGDLELVSSPESAGEAQKFDALVGVIALPRSGTTVVTAVLDVHSRVFGVYEPWNANKDSLDSEAMPSYREFLDRFATKAAPEADVLLVKETATSQRYIDRMGDLMRISDASRKQLVLILRNPLHVFLSEVQARQEWWGAPDLRINAETFSLWAQRTLDALRRLTKMAEEFDTLLLSYERFAGSLRGVNALTEALKLAPEPAQREFEKHLDRSRVRGDNNVGSAPRPVSSASVQQRASEFEMIRPQIEQAAEYPRIKAIAELFAKLPIISRAEDQQDFLQNISK